jgi:hypothetical protein
VYSNGPSSETMIAWFVGLFEGEGTFVNTTKYAGSMRISTTDKDVANRIVEVVGGNLDGPYVSVNGVKDYWVWSLNRREELEILIPKMLPLLGNRRRKRAVALLERLNSRPRVVCGTVGGYQKHHRLGQAPCDDCLQARRDSYKKSRMTNVS